MNCQAKNYVKPKSLIEYKKKQWENEKIYSENCSPWFNRVNHEILNGNMRKRTDIHALENEFNNCGVRGLMLMPLDQKRMYDFSDVGMRRQKQEKLRDELQRQIDEKAQRMLTKNNNVKLEKFIETPFHRAAPLKNSKSDQRAFPNFRLPLPPIVNLDSRSVPDSQSHTAPSYYQMIDPMAHIRLKMQQREARSWLTYSKIKEFQDTAAMREKLRSKEPIADQHEYSSFENPDELSKQQQKTSHYHPTLIKLKPTSDQTLLHFSSLSEDSHQLKKKSKMRTFNNSPTTTIDGFLTYRCCSSSSHRDEQQDDIPIITDESISSSLSISF